MHRAHLVVGGYPPGSTAGHDMDFARRILLERLAEVPDLTTTVASDFSDLLIIQPSRFLVYPIKYRLVESSGKIHRGAMRKMPTVGKVKTKEFISRF